MLRVVAKGDGEVSHEPSVHQPGHVVHQYARQEFGQDGLWQHSRMQHHCWYVNCGHGQPQNIVPPKCPLGDKGVKTVRKQTCWLEMELFIAIDNPRGVRAQLLMLLF